MASLADAGPGISNVIALVVEWEGGWGGWPIVSPSVPAIFRKASEFAVIKREFCIKCKTRYGAPCPSSKAHTKACPQKYI